jgi:hypothetical protein
MITADELRAAWREADALATGKPKAKWIRILQHGCEYLVCADEAAALVLVRCRVCQSLECYVGGPDDAMPDDNQSTRHTHFDSPCGHCRTACLPHGWALRGIRETAKKGGRIGL